MPAYAPSGAGITAASSAPTITRLYLVETSPGVYEFSDSGPEAALIEETSADLYEFSDDTSAAPALRPVMAGTDVLLLT